MRQHTTLFSIVAALIFSLFLLTSLLGILAAEDAHAQSSLAQSTSSAPAHTPEAKGGSYGGGSSRSYRGSSRSSGGYGGSSGYYDDDYGGGGGGTCGGGFGTVGVVIGIIVVLFVISHVGNQMS